MSTLKAGTVQTDTVAAKDGQGIPNNLRSLTPFCYGTIRSGNLQTSLNVSSVTLVNDNAVVKMVTPASSTNYTVHLTRDGSDSNNTYTVNYYYEGYSDGKQKQVDQLSLIVKIDKDPIEWAAVGEVSFLIFDKGQTI